MNTKNQSIMKQIHFALIFIVLFLPVKAQWSALNNNIFNTNAGNVGINVQAPTAPLQISKAGGADGNIFINEPTSNLPIIKMKNNYNIGYDDSWLIQSSSIPQSGAGWAGFFFITHSGSGPAGIDNGTFGLTSSGMATIRGTEIFANAYGGVYPPLGSNSRLTLVHTSMNPEKTLYGNHNWAYWDQPHLRLIQQNDDYARISFESNWIRENRWQDGSGNKAEIIDSNVWVIRAKTNPSALSERFSIYNWLHGGDLFTVAGTGNVGIGTSDPNSKLQVTNGDIYIESIKRGVILKSPDGNCWRITIGNNGNIIRTSITCPQLTQ